MGRCWKGCYYIGFVVRYKGERVFSYYCVLFFLLEIFFLFLSKLVKRLCFCVCRYFGWWRRKKNLLECVFFVDLFFKFGIFGGMMLSGFRYMRGKEGIVEGVCFN